jgi:hypothetical protein
VNLPTCLAEAAARLPDEQLVCEIECAERCALLATRTRREAALLRARCLRLELERRGLAQTRTVVSARSVAAS